MHVRSQNFPRFVIDFLPISFSEKKLAGKCVLSTVEPVDRGHGINLFYHERRELKKNPLVVKVDLFQYYADELFNRLRIFSFISFINIFALGGRFSN